MNSLLVVAALALLVDSTLAFRLSSTWMQRSSSVAGVKSFLGASRDMTMSSGLKINLQGKKIFVAGVADASGYGWAIAKACAEAGATILLGTWPPVLPLFAKGMERGQFDEEMTLSDGSKMNIAKVSFISLLTLSRIHGICVIVITCFCSNFYSPFLP